MTSPAHGQDRRIGVLPGSSTEDSAKTLGRVRDLLFGDAAQAQAEQVAGLEARLTEVQGELRAQLEAQRAELKTQQAQLETQRAALDAQRAESEAALQEQREALRAEFQAELSRVSDALDGHGRAKVERTDLRRLLVDLADRIGGDDDGAEESGQQ